MAKEVRMSYLKLGRPRPEENSVTFFRNVTCLAPLSQVRAIRKLAAKR